MILKRAPIVESLLIAVMADQERALKSRGVHAHDPAARSAQPDHDDKITGGVKEGSTANHEERHRDPQRHL